MYIIVEDTMILFTALNLTWIKQYKPVLILSHSEWPNFNIVSFDRSACNRVKTTFGTVQSGPKDRFWTEPKITSLGGTLGAENYDK